MDIVFKDWVSLSTRFCDIPHQSHLCKNFGLGKSGFNEVNKYFEAITGQDNIIHSIEKRNLKTLTFKFSEQILSASFSKNIFRYVGKLCMLSCSQVSTEKYIKEAEDPIFSELISLYGNYDKKIENPVSTISWVHDTNEYWWSTTNGISVTYSSIYSEKHKQTAIIVRWFTNAYNST